MFLRKIQLWTLGLLALVAAGAWAARPPDRGQPAPPAKASQQPAKTAKQSATKAARRSHSTRDFTPSEHIGADQSVAFPADI